MPLVARFTMEPVLRFVTFLLVAMIAVLLGRLTWVVIAPSSILPPTGGVSSAVSFETPSSVLSGSFRELAALSVFGSAAGKAANPAASAPDTSLSWSLKGILFDPDPSRSAAILLPQGQSEKMYRVGASLPGNVTLEQVLADRVILNRAGRLETLRLKRNQGATASRAKAPALPTADAGVSLADDGGVARIDRDAWVNDPQRFLEVISAKPVMQDGVLHGLEVAPARNAREFEAAGLKAGDVITAVDGSPISGITDYRDLLTELADVSSVSVSLERNGEPMNITITMD